MKEHGISVPKGAVVGTDIEGAGFCFEKINNQTKLTYVSSFDCGGWLPKKVVNVVLPKAYFAMMNHSPSQLHLHS